MQLKSLLARQGADPTRSGIRFLIGFVTFLGGVSLLLHGTRAEQELWQLPGLVLLAAGLPLALWGWGGLLANRLYHFLYN